MKLHRWSAAAVCLLAGAIAIEAQQRGVARSMREVNLLPAPAGAKPTAIVGATLIDGRGGKPVTDAIIVVRGDRITAAGPRGSTPIPAGAEIVEAQGLSALPG